METFLPLFKLGYVFFIIVFAGSVIMGLTWKLLAERSGDPRRIVWAFDNIMKGDKILTFPAVIGIIITSFLIQGSFPFPNFSIEFPLLMTITFGYSLVIFLSVVSPLRRKICQLAAEAVTMESLAKTEYKKLSFRWMLIGLTELVPPVTLLIISLSQL